MNNIVILQCDVNFLFIYKYIKKTRAIARVIQKWRSKPSGLVITQLFSFARENSVNHYRVGKNARYNNNNANQ